MIREIYENYKDAEDKNEMAEFIFKTLQEILGLNVAVYSGAEYCRGVLVGVTIFNRDTANKAWCQIHILNANDKFDLVKIGPDTQIYTEAV